MDKIQEIIQVLKPDLAKVNEIILEFSVGKSPLIEQVAHHLISSGGKRIRPILLVLASKMCFGEVGEGFKQSGSAILGQNLEAQKSSMRHHNLAAAVELIHSATLLHDDVVDTSEIRRGKKTANAIWDNKPSILVGDYIFSIAFQLMVRDGNLRVLELLAKTSSVMADGEVMQLENSNNIEIDEEKYLEIIFGKTAVLFSAATECGALVNNCNEEKIEALRNFGKNLGVVFQIIDDILDYKAQEKDLGKDIGNDFFEGKVTLPIIFSYQKADANDKKLIKNLLEENLMTAQKDQNKFLEICALINQYKGFEDSFSLAQEYKNLAINNLSIFSDSIYKEYLLDILEYSFNRKT